MKLPIYPGARARDVLSASQVAALNNTIAIGLAQVLSLPPEKRDKPSSIAFVSSYAKDHAQRILNALIWEPAETRSGRLSKLSRIERTIHERTLRLVEKLARDLDVQSIVDLAVVYGPTNPKRFRALLLEVSTNPQIAQALESEGVPAFTTLLSSNAQGLYGLRKISYILSATLRCAPPEIVRPFARKREFVLALAKAYDDGLSTCVRSYGGIRPARIREDAAHVTLDDWERIFLETKVAFTDSFRMLLMTLLKDVEEIATPGPSLAARCEVAFEIIFALLELSPSQQDDTGPVPFLNQSLLADYQHTYDLSHILSDLTRRADDPRTELLESTLQSLDTTTSSQDPRARSGALRLLLRSSGAQPGIDNLGIGPSRAEAKDKGRAVAPPIVAQDPALDAAVAQVLDILPEQPPEYVRFVLAHPDYAYKGDAERLIGALLEGTAPSLEEYEAASTTAVQDRTVADEAQETFVYTKERQNVFDQEVMDISQVRIGKKKDDGSQQDKEFIDQMKADILRRAEEMFHAEEDDDVGAQGKGIDVAFEDELVESGFKVRDGDDTEDVETDDGSDGEGGEEKTPKTPETILELAYIANPKVFDRDANTRRSKARNDLRTQTGWADEQIEGWRIMLERDPNKDRILQKHEFAGNNRSLALPGPSRSSQPSPSPGRGQGRGRGGGGGGDRGMGRGGRGRGRGGGPGGDGASSARERAWKDKNKASRGNHNRKRGHDKKMARAGGPEVG